MKYSTTPNATNQISAIVSEIERVSDFKVILCPDKSGLARFRGLKMFNILLPRDSFDRQRALRKLEVAVKYNIIRDIQENGVDRYAICF